MSACARARASVVHSVAVNDAIAGTAKEAATNFMSWNKRRKRRAARLSNKQAKLASKEGARVHAQIRTRTHVRDHARTHARTQVPGNWSVPALFLLRLRRAIHSRSVPRKRRARPRYLMATARAAAAGRRIPRTRTNERLDSQIDCSRGRSQPSRGREVARLVRHRSHPAPTRRT